MEMEQEVKPFTEVLNIIKTLIETTVQEFDCQDYDKLFCDAYRVLQQDDSCQDKIRTLIESSDEDEDALIKDKVQAAKLREEGNEYFKTEKYSEALNCYNQSVMIAPCPQTSKHQTDFVDFALSLTNRAAVLGKYKLHRNVIEDLSAAIACGYPKHLLYKAYQRLAVAYKATGDEDKSLITYQQLLKSLDDADINPEKIKKMKNDCRQIIKTFPSNLTVRGKDSPQHLLTVQNPNADIPSLSSKVTIERTEMRGRFAVAREFIKAGEVIAVDVSAMMSITPSKTDSHCLHCSKSCMAPLPCSSCCRVVFCSEDCREREMTAHMRECRLGQFVSKVPASSNMFLSPVLGTLRLLLKMEYNFHLSTFRASQAGAAGTDPDQISYTKLLMMVKHFDDINISQHIATCGVIVNILKCLDYLPKTVNIDDQTVMFQIICHYHAALLSNIHTTSELRNANNFQVTTSPVAIALFPDIALHINHSCDPNTFVIDMADSQATVASRDIQIGEEISQVYCGHYGDTEREKRQALLQKRYHFQCRCQACHHNYPLAQTCLEQCKTFAETPSSGLKMQLSVEELRELDEKNEECKVLVERALQKGQVKVAVELTVKRLNLISTHLKQPHILYVMGRMSLINYMSYLYSNKALTFKPQKLPVYF